MKAVHRVEDLLELVEAGACSNGLAAAARTGNYSRPKNVVLPWGNRGWTFEVVSQSGTRWSVLIEVREIERRYKVHSRRVL